MLAAMFNFGKAIVHKGVQWLNQQRQHGSRPRDGHAVLETVTDLMRPKSELVLENAVLRQQVIVLQRQVKRPKMSHLDRRLLVLLPSRLQAWRSALLVVKPETLLQWHRDLFRLVWRHKSKAKLGRPPLAPEVIAVI